MKSLVIKSALVLGAIAAVAFPAAAQTTFSNTTPILIPGTGTSGVGSPYPSNIAVSGLTGTITNITVSLTGITHTFPDDIDILMVGPTGTSVILMSDCGGSNGITGVNLTFSNSATASLPDSALITSGTYLPTNVGAGDPFASPAPTGPYGSTLSSYFGAAPNGTYSLYVVDDLSGDTGSISGGWSVTITTTPAVVPEPGTFALLGLGIAGAGVIARRRFAAKA